MSILSKIKSLFVKEAKADEMDVDELNKINAEKNKKLIIETKDEKSAEMLENWFNKEDIVVENTKLQETKQKETEKQENSTNQQENSQNEITYTLDKKQFEEICENVYIKVQERILELLNQNRITPMQQEIIMHYPEYVEEDNKDTLR